MQAGLRRVHSASFWLAFRPAQPYVEWSKQGRTDMFEAVSASFFAALFVVWTKADWGNVAVKLAFFAMAAWGFVEALENFGFIIAPARP